MTPAARFRLMQTAQASPLTDADRRSADAVAVSNGMPAMGDATWTKIRDGIHTRADRSGWSVAEVQAAARVVAARGRRLGFFV